MSVWNVSPDAHHTQVILIGHTHTNTASQSQDSRNIHVWLNHQILLMSSQLIPGVKGVICSPSLKFNCFIFFTLCHHFDDLSVCPGLFLLPPQASVSIDTRPCWIINLEFLATEGRDYREKCTYTHIAREQGTLPPGSNLLLSVCTFWLFLRPSPPPGLPVVNGFFFTILFCVFYRKIRVDWLIRTDNWVTKIPAFYCFSHHGIIKNLCSSGELPGPRVATQRHQSASRPHQ